MALVLSAFTWSYALGQIPAGWLGDRFGPKRVLTSIMSWWSIAAMLTGAALGLGLLFAARFLLGLGEAGAFPVASRGMQLWFPRSGRAHPGHPHFFSRFAVAVTPFVDGSIMLAFGWRAIFYIFGSLGLIWSAAFLSYYRNRPEEHARVNRAELVQIHGLNPDGSLKTSSTARQAAPWKRILASPNMWFIALWYCCFFFGTELLLDLVSNLPEGTPAHDAPGTWIDRIDPTFLPVWLATWLEDRCRISSLRGRATPGSPAALLLRPVFCSPAYF